MAGNLTDNLQLVAVEGSITSLASPGKAVGATSLNIASAVGWPTTTGFTFAIRTVTATGVYIAGTYTEWLGTISGTAIYMGTSPSPVYGTDQVYTAGTTTQVYIPVSAYSHNLLITALLQQHTQAGGHGAITATSLNNSGTSLLSGNVTLGAALIPSETSITSASTITPTINTTNFYNVSALAVGATVAAPTGTPVDGQLLTLRITDNGSPQSLSWNSIYNAVQYVNLPSATTAGQPVYIAMRYNSALTSWDVLGVGIR